MSRPYRDTFTITRLQDGRWRAVCHGEKGMEWIGDTATAVLAEAGRMSDYAAKGVDEFRKMMAAEDQGGEA